MNKTRRLVDFGVRDRVWVKTTNWATDRPSRKLAEQMASPWEIFAKEGYSYRLALPASMKIHSVFFISQLRLVSNDPLPSQINVFPLLIKVVADDEYKV